jgi:hypothetical protein
MSADEGIYTNVGGSLNVVADEGTAVPGGSGNFINFGDPSLYNGSVAFQGESGAVMSSDEGIYTNVGGSLNVVADEGTAVPGGTGNFINFGDPSLYNGSVAFQGESGAVMSSDEGIYTNLGGSLSLVADESIEVPGAGGATFLSFQELSHDATNVAFVGEHGPVMSATRGIFVLFNGSLESVVEEGQTLDGRTLRGVLMSREALNGNQLAFRARFGDGSSGIYVATIPEPSTGLLLASGLVALCARRRGAIRTPDPRAI